MNKWDKFLIDIKYEELKIYISIVGVFVSIIGVVGALCLGIINYFHNLDQDKLLNELKIGKIEVVDFSMREYSDNIYQSGEWSEYNLDRNEPYLMMNGGRRIILFDRFHYVLYNSNTNFYCEEFGEFMSVSKLKKRFEDNFSGIPCANEIADIDDINLGGNKFIFDEENKSWVSIKGNFEIRWKYYYDIIIANSGETLIKNLRYKIFGPDLTKQDIISKEEQKYFHELITISNKVLLFESDEKLTLQPNYNSNKKLSISFRDKLGKIQNELFIELHIDYVDSNDKQRYFIFNLKSFFAENNFVVESIKEIILN